MNALINWIQIVEHIGDEGGQILLRVVPIDSVGEAVLAEVELYGVRANELYFGRRWMGAGIRYIGLGNWEFGLICFRGDLGFLVKFVLICIYAKSIES